jgi:hypothetical protein
MITPENAILRERLRKTAAGRTILDALKLSGNENKLLGKGVFKKIGKGLKSVGKVTGKITGRIAKVAAGLVGIPPGAIDALAKIDPTAHKGLVKNLQASAAGAKAAQIIAATDQTNAIPANFFTNIKPVYLVAGAAGIIGIIFLISSPKTK